MPIKPNPIARILHSSRGIAAIIATVIGTLGVFALTWSYFHGKIPTEQFFDRLDKIGIGVTAAWCFYMGTTAVEDYASKSQGPITAGGNITVHNEEPVVVPVVPVDVAAKETPVP